MLGRSVPHQTDTHKHTKIRTYKDTHTLSMRGRSAVVHKYQRVKVPPFKKLEFQGQRLKN